MGKIIQNENVIANFIKGGGSSFTPISWSTATPVLQANRTISFNGEILTSHISSTRTSCGLVHLPFDITNTDYVFISYDIVGASTIDNQWYPSIFFSTTVISNATTKSADLNSRQLTQATVLAGNRVTKEEILSVPNATGQIYLNVQLGLMQFENMKIYSVKL